MQGYRWAWRIQDFLLFAFLSARLKSLKKEVGLPDQQQHWAVMQAAWEAWGTKKALGHFFKSEMSFFPSYILFNAFELGMHLMIESVHFRVAFPPQKLLSSWCYPRQSVMSLKLGNRAMYTCGLQSLLKMWREWSLQAVVLRADYGWV